MLLVPPSLPTGVLRFRWIDPKGVSRELSRDTSPNLFVTAGSIGLGSLAVQIQDEKYASFAGAFLRQINTDTRNLDIPIIIHEDSFEDAISVADDLFEWFDTGDETRQTPGYFEIQRPDDSIRRIQCYYISGLEGNLKEGGPNWFVVNVKLYCPTPHFTSDQEKTIIKDVAGAGSFAIINSGNLLTWPVWKFTGPFTNISLYNVTTGKLLISYIDVAAGHYLIVDTRPTELRDVIYSVYDDLGVNKQYTVIPTSDLWPLMPGQNNIQQIFTSGTSVATTTTVTYLEQFRSALR